MANGISASDKILLDLLANSLFDAGLQIDCEQTSLADLFKEAKEQTVLAVAFDALPKCYRETDPELYKKWQGVAFKIAQINIKQLHANVRLESMFKAAGIPICTIKGFVSDYYYSKQHLRHMGDIDFIVPEDMMMAGKKLLDDNGFVCSVEEHDHDFHFRHTKDGEVYEMHKGITSFYDENGHIEKFISDIFEHTQVVEFSGLTLTVPDKFSHGLIMLLHMHRHMIDGGGVGLRHLCDWAAFVNAFDNDEWKLVFEDKLKSIKLWKFAKVLSKASCEFLKIKPQEWFNDIDCDLAQTLLEDMIIGGNFGGKDHKRYQEVAYLSQTEKDKNVFSKYFKNYVKKVGFWRPIYKKHKLLLPFGMVAYFFRTSFLIIFGKRKLDFSNATTRNNLYGEIFEIR